MKEKTTDKIIVNMGQKMKAKEFIKMLEDNLTPDAEMDFLCIGNSEAFWLDIISVNMNVDVDDPENRYRGGVVFSMRTIE